MRRAGYNTLKLEQENEKDFSFLQFRLFVKKSERQMALN
jgi:hypothetical protein